MGNLKGICVPTKSAEYEKLGKIFMIFFRIIEKVSIQRDFVIQEVDVMSKQFAIM